MALLDEYMPADMPTGDIDPRELEKARYLAMMRLGLGMAGREPLGSSASGAIKAYALAQGNARQNMLAQLQAYKTRQEIGAKAKAAKDEQELATEAAGIYSNTPLITQPGGPTNANAALQGNATFGMVEQLRQHAISFYKRGKTEDGKRLMDSAKDMVVKYGLTPYYSLDSNGMLQASQLSETGQVRVLPGRPAEETSYHDAGGNIFESRKYTGQTGMVIPKTQTFGERTAAAAQRLNQDKFNYEKTAPVWDANSGQFVYRPTEAAPTGSAAVPQGYVRKDDTTDTQLRVRGFHSRMVASSKIINDLEDKGYTPSFGAAYKSMVGKIPLLGSTSAGLVGAAGNWATDDKMGKYEQAASEWVRAKIRPESGAVISPEEMREEIRTYFPQPEDSAAVKEQKRQSRKVAEQASAIQAGFKRGADDPLGLR